MSTQPEIPPFLARIEILAGGSALDIPDPASARLVAHYLEHVIAGLTQQADAMGLPPLPPHGCEPDSSTATVLHGPDADLATAAARARMDQLAAEARDRGRHE